MARKRKQVEQVAIEQVEETKVETQEVTEAPVEETKVETQEVTEAPVEETKVEETQKAQGVGKRIRFLIQEGIEDNKGILNTIKNEFPHGRTTMACISWYRADMKKKKLVNDQPFIDWKKQNGFDEASLRAKFEAEQAKTKA